VQLRARLGLDFLDLLETAALNEGAFGLELCREDLGKLGANVLQDVVGSKLKEWLQSWHMSAHLDDVLEGFL